MSEQSIPFSGVEGEMCVEMKIRNGRLGVNGGLSIDREKDSV